MATRRLYRARLADGKNDYSGNNESLTPEEMLCSNCSHTYNQFTSKCSNCGKRFWSPWLASWYENPFTYISLGQSPKARLYGKSFIGATVLIVIYACWVFHLANSNDQQWQRLVVFCVLMTYSAYEVWAFTHGRRTSIDHWTYEGTPSNTSMRVYGLVLDLIIFLGAICLMVLGE